MYDWEQDKRAGKEVCPPLPSMMIVPSHLVGQAYREAINFTAGTTDILVYHGDDRKQLNTMKMVKGTLTRDHEYFAAHNDKNIRRIIITTHSTLDTRHRPQKLQAWRRSRRVVGRTPAEDAEMAQHPDWDCSFLLPNLWNVVAVDESHFIKRITSHWSRAIEWLIALFYLLASATPASNNISDWKGYFKFLQPRKEPKTAAGLPFTD